METTILALDEELQEKDYNQKCSPECQLKLEPKTESIGGHIAEIFHFLCLKVVSRVAEMYGNGSLGSG